MRSASSVTASVPWRYASLMMIALAEKATAEKTTSATPARREARVGVGAVCTGAILRTSRARKGP